MTIGAGGFIGLANDASSVPSDIASIASVRVLDTRDAANVGSKGPFVSATGQDLKATGAIATADGHSRWSPTERRRCC